MARILIVDDEQEVGELCSTVLSVEGHDVEYAKDGHKALEIVDKELFDLAIVDLVMPGIDGLEVVRRLREKFSDMGIIVFTGFASVDIAVKAMKEGADDFLSKPVWNQVLSECVASVIASRQGNKKALPSDLLKRTDEKPASGINPRLLHGFTDSDAEELLRLGESECHEDTGRVALSNTEDIILVLKGAGELWSSTAPMCSIADGEAVGEEKVFNSNNGNEPLSLEVAPNTELLKIKKDDLVSFFKSKDEKLLMLFAINVVNSLSKKLDGTFHNFSGVYRKMHSAAA